MARIRKGSCNWESSGRKKVLALSLSPMPLWSKSWAKTGSILICPASCRISDSIGPGFRLHCISSALPATFNSHLTLSSKDAFSDLLGFMVENLNFQFGKSAEHFHDPTILFHGQVHGPLELVFFEVGTVKMVFDRHRVIIPWMFLGQFGLGLDPKIVHFQFHLFDQGSHVQPGTSGQGRQHQGLGSQTVPFPPPAGGRIAL